MSNKVPKIRFNGYSDAWVQRKFSDLYKKNLERNKEQFGSDRTISIATMRFKEEGNGASEDSLASYKVLREGDVAFEGHTSKQFAFGRFVLNDIGDGIMSPRFTTLRPTQDMPIAFWKQYIHYEPIMRYPIVHSTKLGTMMNELVVDEFLNQSVLVPSVAEQLKIGQLLTLVDNLIAANQRKLDLLKEQKKGYLQKMFPKNGAKVPELRFAGFADDWEERKLGEISRMYQPITITGNDLLPDGVPVFGANGFIGFFSEANHIDDQVTISARGEGSGTPSYVHGPVWITGNSMVVNVDDFHIDKYFLFANLTANSLKKFVTGGAQPQLTRDVLVKVPITLPNADEQQKIGSFFKQLDDTIALHQRKLDLLKEQKKGFLQNMFV
ncbi:restriction endonuclease subunit S [Leuconostoc sp. LN180020]|uniref:restriction endonuclease subunit S n=1 Tax=Leuconostoc sp. LN180020 TaxID=2571156 RepID=UPI001FAB9024|nr:restriction endonuclease subunit S [Leuconostoc sp. LN180020]